MRAIVTVLLLAAVGLVAYNYGAGRGLSVQLPGAWGGSSAATVRGGGADLADRAAAKATTAVSRTEQAVTETTVASKIKAKMALDDVVKAGRISVEANGSVVTLTGDVSSPQERQRALRLAKETDGVTSVVDRLHVRK